MDALNSYPICSLIALITFSLVSIKKPFVDSFNYAAVGNRQFAIEKAKAPRSFPSVGLLFWRRPTLAQPIVALPSGLQRFTSVFGMGTGGATALLSPEVSAAHGANFW